MTKTNLTPEQISEIQAAYRDSANPKKQIGILADLYDTTENMIREMLGLPAEPDGAKKKRIFRSYDQAVKEDVVKAVLLEGMTNREAAEKFSVPYGNVSAWVNKARKKQAEFDQYAEEVQAEQTPETTTVSEDMPAQDAVDKEENITRLALQEVKDGVSGLDTFLDGYAGICVLHNDEREMMRIICARAHGFLSGMQTGINLMRGEAKVVASDS